MTARAQLIAELTPIVPYDWAVIPYEDDLDVPDKVTLMIRQRSYVKLPQAPLGKYKVSFVLTLIAPATDFQKAEDTLDDALGVLLPALDGVNTSLWQTADKVIAENRLAYDITLDLIADKE